MIRHSDPIHRARHTARGFSLVELVAVLIIVGIIAAAAAPALSRAAETKAESGIAQLERDLLLARDLACHGGVRTWVVFSLPQQRYELFVEHPDAPGKSGRQTKADPSTGRPFVRSVGGPEWSGVSTQSITFDNGAEIGFDWQGLPVSVNEQPLLADGVITFSNGRRVVISRTSGIAARD